MSLNIYRSPFKLLIIIALSVFVTEFSIMILFSILSPFQVWVGAIIDSTLLVAILFPTLYFFLVNPLVMHINECKKIEETLRESEAKNRAILEAIPDMIFRISKEGTFLDFKASKELEPLVPPGEFLGKNVYEVLPSQLAQQSLQYIEQALETSHTQMFEYVLPIKGCEHDFKAEIIAIGNNETLIFVRDITVHKKVEELYLENERLILANKAKSQFLATMSHELRTPLNAILGFSGLLKQKTMGELNEKQMNYVENVISGGKRLHDLIAKILDLTKIEAGKMEIMIEKMSVPEAVDEILNLVKASALKRNVILKKEIDPQLKFIEADKNEINQIIFNLLDNAVKFSKPGGGIVTVKTIKEGEMARISVSDTGIGIKEEDMGKLFKEFEQIDSGISRKYGGTGLGLAISKKLVELHGGKITIESRYGEGSTFTILLPIKTKKREENG